MIERIRSAFSNIGQLMYQISLIGQGRQPTLVPFSTLGQASTHTEEKH